jgi:hypothetical protein
MLGGDNFNFALGIGMIEFVIEYYDNSTKVHIYKESKMRNWGERHNYEDFQNVKDSANI